MIMPGPQEMLLIFLIIILLFGASKLPELARSMGKSVGEFKKAQKESELILKDLDNPQLSKVQQTARNLGIYIEDKTDDELMEEIEKSTRN
jgi:sec-independent protein translocase protein TatA